MQTIVTLDMEGVLTPEIWIAVAEKTGIERLRLTTRDIPDYDVLMRGRLQILKENNLGIADIQNVIATLDPLEGALPFLRELRSIVQVIILSDTFEQFAEPLIRKMEWPSLFCHRLKIVDGRVEDYVLRQPNQKQKAVEALRSLNYQVIAAGDSFNDISMLKAANTGYLFRSPDSIKKQFPEFIAFEEYAELLAAVRAAI